MRILLTVRGSWVAIALATAVRAGCQTPTLRIIGTNDLHGALEPRADAAGRQRGGVVALASAIKRARDECAAPACYSIVVDAGDEFQGQPASTLALGKPISEIFNAIGYDVAALGNHDLDWGREVTQLRMAEEHYPVLSANLRTTDGRPLDWIRADTVIRRGPFVVGVIGIMTTSANTSIAAKNIVGLRFVDPVPIVDSLATRLRARGANVVIVLAHAGGMCDPTGTLNCRGEILEDARRFTQKIDAIVAGHIHELINTTVNDIPITVARTNGEAVGVIDLSSGGTSRHEVRLVYADSLPRDPAIARMVAAAITAAGPKLNEPVATIAEDLDRDADPLANLIVDGMRAAGRADFAVTNQTGIRAPLRAGVATYGTLFEIQPFANRLVLVSASGASMRRYFNMMTRVRGLPMPMSGAVVTLDTSQAPGARVTSVRLPDGRELDDRANYTIVITDFLATGGLGMAFPDSTAVTRDLGVLDLEATIAYLRSLTGPVRGRRDPRWILR